MAQARKTKASKAKGRPVAAAKKAVSRSKPAARGASASKAKPKAKAKAKPAARRAPAAAKPASATTHYHTLTPVLNLKGTDKAIDFYKAAFGATERMRMPGPGGMIMHAELVIGDSTLMLAESMNEAEAHTKVHVYVDDCDAFFDRALAAGAQVKRPLEDMFWGDRYGELSDPFGGVWSVATHKRDVSPEEMQAAMAAMPSP